MVPCLPCLHPDCRDFDSRRTKQSLRDECAICQAEDLSQAPLVQIGGCGHLFHIDCVRRRLQTRWTSRRIDFAFLKCPLCSALIKDLPQLQDLLQPNLQLRAKLREQAFQRLLIEGLHKGPEVGTPGSEWYRRPRAYALHHYAFFSCNQCKKPYFAGAAACGAADEDPNAESVAACVCIVCAMNWSSLCCFCRFFVFEQTTQYC